MDLGSKFAHKVARIDLGGIDLSQCKRASCYLSSGTVSIYLLMLTFLSFS
jgi:hypothetical protein